MADTKISGLTSATSVGDVDLFEIVQSGTNKQATGLMVAANSGRVTPTASKTSNYTAVFGDLVLCDVSGGTFTVTLPSAAKAGIVAITKTDNSATALTISRAGSDTIYGLTNGGQSTISVRRQGDVYVLVSDGSASWYVLSALSSAYGFSNVQGSGSADYTTSSSTFVDVDATNLIITTANAQQNDILKIEADLTIVSDASGHNMGVTFNIAGSDVGDTLGLCFTNQTLANASHISYFYTMPSNSAVTIKLRFSMSAGTATIYNRSAVVRPRMSVINLGPALAV